MKVFVANWTVDLDTYGVIGVYDSLEKADEACHEYAKHQDCDLVPFFNKSVEKSYDLNYKNKTTYETCFIESFDLNKKRGKIY